MLRDGLAARTPIKYRLTVCIHDGNRERTLEWWERQGLEPLPTEHHESVRNYAPGERPWVTEADDRSEAYGACLWLQCFAYYRNGKMVTLTGDVIEQVERLCRLGRVRRAGLTEAKEWA